MMNKPEQGFTLVELMIALVLGLIVTGGVVAVFVQSRQSFRVDEQVARMQDEARFALDEISRDVRMANYLAEPLVPAAVFPDFGLVVGTDCGVPAQPNWIMGFTDAVTGEINSLTGVDNATAATASASFSCIAATEIRPNTDVVGVKRVAGDFTAPANLQNGTTYIRSNGTFGLLHTQPPAGLVPPPFQDWEYRPRVYYIRTFSNAPGDGIPALCRKVLTGGTPPSMTTECIAQGIEDLQIEYGLDTDGDAKANRYLTSPTLTQLQQVVSARISLLARTQEIDTRYTDARTYSVSNAPAYTPNDNFRRRVYSTTVTVHNRRNIRRLGIGL
jgi:prepilin-type N-terminal cleavage/methylation domain-containing protein